MALPTIPVTPGFGAVINTLPNAPQNTAGSVAVAIATDQSAIPSIVVGVAYAPSGSSTVTSTFSATGSSSAFTPVYGRPFNVSVWGTFNATLVLECSFDGSTWIPSNQSAFPAQQPFARPLSFPVTECEHGVNYRLTCSSFTSGPINYRISQ